MRAALISLEPWDQVWRRNQHLTAQLVEQGLATEVIFVEPPTLTRRPGTTRRVHPGVLAVSPALRLPKRAGGLVLAGALLRTALHGRVDVLWINDAVLGVHCLDPHVPAVYDVTDDWRTFDFPQRIIQRLVRAETRLARTAGTVVCSDVLAERWRSRYGVSAPVVHNGIDLDAWKGVVPSRLEGPGPHVGYIGTLHEKRLDVDLVLRIAEDERVGQLHLVGPDSLGEETRRRLHAHSKIAVHGPVMSSDVPAWTTAMDVLVTPHLVNDFTLSLDAIKAYEYLASGRPVVATPTSGFQLLSEPGLIVAGPDDFMAGVARAVEQRVPLPRDPTQHGWAVRARDFAHVLDAVRSTPTGDRPRRPMVQNEKVST